MEFNSAICTSLEQSKRLLDFGLRPETADMYYFWLGGNEYRLKVDDDNNSLKYNMDKTYIPAWSLHRLIVMMPSFIDVDENPFYLESKISQGKLVSYESIIDDSIGFVWGHGNLYDSIISCIGQLIKECHFNKEYLKE